MNPREGNGNPPDPRTCYPHSDGSAVAVKGGVEAIASSPAPSQAKVAGLRYGNAGSRCRRLWPRIGNRSLLRQSRNRTLGIFTMPTTKPLENQDSAFRRVVDYFLRTEKKDGERLGSAKPKRLGRQRKKPSTKAKS